MIHILSLRVVFRRCAVIARAGVVMAAFCGALSYALLPLQALASCSKITPSDPARVRIESDAALIVTHASARYDARLATKQGVEAAIRYAKSRKHPVIYLLDDSPPEQYLPGDCDPDHWIHSQDGELPVEVRAANVFVAGGHLEVCLTNTLIDVLEKWAKLPRQDLSVTYFMDAIYSNGKEVAQSDPWQRQFADFMSVVTYGRPGTDDWPKVTLLETLGVIVNETRQFAYLERILPHFHKFISSDYRVEIVLNGKSKIVQRGRGTRAPVLRFRFVDSAIVNSQQARSIPGTL